MGQLSDKALGAVFVLDPEYFTPFPQFSTLYGAK